MITEGCRMIFLVLLAKPIIPMIIIQGNFYIKKNTIKTTFYFNFDFYQAFKQHGYTLTWKQREAVIYCFSLFTSEIVI